MGWRDCNSLGLAGLGRFFNAYRGAGLVIHSQPKMVLRRQRFNSHALPTPNAADRAGAGTAGSVCRVARATGVARIQGQHAR